MSSITAADRELASIQVGSRFNFWTALSGDTVLQYDGDTRTQEQVRQDIIEGYRQYDAAVAKVKAEKKKKK